jgi:outer membrane protein OmpA-like peptidoglycan-associated protein
MKKLLLLITVLALSACASHEAPKKTVPCCVVTSNTKGGFVVEHHEPPIGVLDTQSKTLDNVELFAKKIYFAPGSAKITPEGRKVLNGLMGMMQVELAYTIHIVGLSDETEKKPVPLSMRRALSVAQLLRANGIDEKRIRVNGQGQDLNLSCMKLSSVDRKSCLQAERAVILTNKY